jgi:hypothetical protein
MPQVGSFLENQTKVTRPVKVTFKGNGWTNTIHVYFKTCAVLDHNFQIWTFPKGHSEIMNPTRVRHWRRLVHHIGLECLIGWWASLVLYF